MEIGNIGYNHHHDKEFVMELPVERSSWLFLLIKTPAFFEINGVRTLTEGNSFILYQYGTAQKYGANGTLFGNDWIYISVTNEDIDLFKALEIPLDTVVPLGDVSEFSALICTMAFEFRSSNMYNTDIGELYLKLLFFKLSERLKNRSIKGRGSATANFDRLQHLREYIYDFPDIQHTVDEIAGKFTMSRSSFQHNYKLAFGKSFVADVRTARIKRAKFLLITTRMTVAQIGLHCGYNSDLHFIRQFKAETGVTPTEYREQHH